MANEPEFSKTGVWLDRTTGKIVKAKPQHGIQIVRPGGELTKARKAAIAAAEAASGPVVETAVDTAPVETATDKAPSTRKPRS